MNMRKSFLNMWFMMFYNVNQCTLSSKYITLYAKYAHLGTFLYICIQIKTFKTLEFKMQIIHKKLFSIYIGKSLFSQQCFVLFIYF